MIFYVRLMRRYRELYGDSGTGVTVGLLRSLLAQLPAEDQLFLEVRFGRDGDAKTLKQVSEALKIGEGAANIAEHRSLGNLYRLFQAQAKGQTSRQLFSLGLTHRTRNALLRAGIDTVERLLIESEGSLLTLQGFGRASLEEVKRVLRQEDLKLR